MLTTHLALISFIFARAGGGWRRRTSPLRSVARRIGRAFVGPRRPRPAHDLPLSNHLRRDIGLNPLPRDPFRG